MRALTAVESIFTSALTKPTPEALAAYLNQVCGADAGLRLQVERLLRANGRAGAFLNGSAPVATVDEAPASDQPGAWVGPYKLLEQIGEGGMGEVWVADQQEPIRRRVALKVIKPGMDSRAVLARFEAERQALALMDHPNIAKVLDAGSTPDGRPYFVMELVKGTPITDFCDIRKLSPRERLGLFVPVCQAIQHAHQKGVIHRDIKPSNVLVELHDDRPVPKVIDFGVAKAVGQRLTDKTLYTGYGALVGTPAYMAPEQATFNALDVDTRADVYSLGVLLYELLAGSPPFEPERLRLTALDEVLRLVREQEPPRPSARLSTSQSKAAIAAVRQSDPDRLARLMRGELDWVVMRALEKDRARRYDSAAGLARDVERYLRDEPVEACPPTAGYRLRKFARTHRRLLATTTGFAALLLLGIAASTWQAVRATQAEMVALANENQATANAVQAKDERDEAHRQRNEVRALNERLERTLYAANMNLAHNAWEAVGVGRVRELLEQHRPKPGESDLRNFEWHYLNRLCHADLLTLKGHTGGAWSVAYSPDGKYLAGSGGSGAVKVWDVQTGQELLTLKGHTGRVASVAFSPDGKRLAGSPAQPGDLKVWDAQTGQELITIKGSVNCVAFSPDGKRLASTDPIRGGVTVWDAQTGKDLLSFKPAGSVGSLAFSPDGKRLVTGNVMVKVWDAQTGQELLALKGHTARVWGVAYSPDGKRLASTDQQTQTVKVWDAQTGEELLTFKGGGLGCVVFSPDGKRLASTDQQTVKVYDAQTGQELLIFKGHTDWVCRVTFSPDGKHLASASLDKTVKVWDAQAIQKPLKLQGEATLFAGMAFSPDGKRVASGSQGPSPIDARVWDAQTGQELLNIKGAGGRAWLAVFSPDGRRLAGSGEGGALKVWDAQTGQELLTLKGHTGGVYSVAFSPDGKRLATSSRGPGPGDVKVWDAQTGQELLSLKGHTGQVNSMAFSSDGQRLASTSGDTTLKVWDAQTGQEFLTLKGHTDWVNHVVFSPDGKRLASAAWDYTVKVWDAQTSQEPLTLKGHTHWVRRVVFSPDGKRLASTSSDNTVKVWDAQTGHELLTFKGRVRRVAFSPDGHRLMSGSDDGTVTIWDATPVRER